MKRYSSGARHHIAVTLNGSERSGYCEPRLLLSDFLREELGATGVNVGCEHGICGSCTVSLDGVPVRSCLMLAVQAEGRRVDTVEALAPSPERLSDLQEAFRRNHALQCGFCTPGILIACEDFLKQHTQPTEHQVREMLTAHLCRCTGYTSIVNAVLDAAAVRHGQSGARS